MRAAGPQRACLLEARDRLGGRTWSADWDGWQIEYGGAWVHWHQPHTFSELTRAGLETTLGPTPQRAHWYVGAERHEGTIAERDAIAQTGLGPVRRRRARGAARAPRAAARDRQARRV